MFDVRATRENTLEIYPLSLNIDPYVCREMNDVNMNKRGEVTEKNRNSIKLFLP
jgi:hypothetical protein